MVGERAGKKENQTARKERRGLPVHAGQTTRSHVQHAARRGRRDRKSDAIPPPVGLIHYHATRHNRVITDLNIVYEASSQSRYLNLINTGSVTVGMRISYIYLTGTYDVLWKHAFA